MLIDCSLTSELVVCNTSPAAEAVPSSTTTTLSAGSIARRSPAPAAEADRPSASRVVVDIDDQTVSSDGATFVYVDDPVVTDVIDRDSILRSAFVDYWSVLEYFMVISWVLSVLNCCTVAQDRNTVSWACFYLCLCQHRYGHILRPIFAKISTPIWVPKRKNRLGWNDPKPKLSSHIFTPKIHFLVDNNG